MTFTQANILLDEIIAFLLSCGGVYTTTNTDLETRILECITWNQYVIRRDDNGAIIHVICYWLVNKSELESLAEGCQPIERHRGDTMCIIEHGNKAGRKSLTDVVKELRCRAGHTVTGVLWNHKGDGYKCFMKQKGMVPSDITHDDLTGPYVVTAAVSLQLQNIAPDLKPVVKGTHAEVLQLQRENMIPAERHVFYALNGAAYIIAEELQPFSEIKRLLVSGGNAESILLGYPSRDGLNPDELTHVAVDMNGTVLTGTGSIFKAAYAKRIIWAAQGNSCECQYLAQKISKRITAIKEVANGWRF